MTDAEKGRIIGVIPALVLVAILAALVAFASGEGAQGALTDPEPPAQYDDWDSAYDLSEQELGTPFRIRKEGGGDHDYVRIPFLSQGDRVTIEVEIDNASNSAEWWVSDPGRFPIWFYSYKSGQANPMPRKFEFLATLPGPYWFHTGQGFGVMVLEVNISSVPSSGRGDGNDRPEDARLIEGTSVVNGTIGPPDDCSDFYWFHLAPTMETKVFLTFSLTVYGGAAVSWELYSSTGISREQPSYTSDAWRFGPRGQTLDVRIVEADSYYLRVWSNWGGGDYRLDVSMVEYPDDGNDEAAGAQEISDGDVVNGTIHTKYDIFDHYRVNLTEGDLLQLWMDVDDDVDLFLLSGFGSQVALSDNWDDESEHISYRVPPGGNGTYYVLVTISSEIDPLPLREVAYQLRVATNRPPQVDEAYSLAYANWPMLEDWVDEGIFLPNLFRDPEGGPLTFRVVPGHDDVRLSATVTGAMRLRLEPAGNLSGFTEMVVVEATDEHGRSIRFTISVFVTPVNDGPVVGNPNAPLPPAGLEMYEDSTGGPWDILFWFWDCDNDMSEMEVELSTGNYLVADQDDMDRLRIRVLVPDWNGLSTVRVTVRDPEGLSASITMPVLVLPVNDPPVIVSEDITGRVSGDLSAVFVLKSYFFDADGDTLTYEATSDDDLSFTFWDSTLIVDGILAYQYGSTTFKVQARDPEGLPSGWLTVHLEVGDVPEPHVLTTDVEEYTMVRGRGQLFLDIEFTDPDDPPMEYNAYLTGEGHGRAYRMNWNDTGLVWNDEAPQWTPWPGGGDADVVVTLYVADEWYNVSVSWTVHVREANQPPEVLRFYPDRPDPYREGEPVTFTVEAIDGENDTLTYIWYFDGRPSVGGNTYTIGLLREGERSIRVEVSDGFDTTAAERTYTVWKNVDDPRPPNWILPLIVLLLVASIVGVVMILTRR